MIGLDAVTKQVVDVDSIGYITKPRVYTKHLARGRGTVIDDGMDESKGGENYVTVMDTEGRLTRLVITYPEGDGESNLPFLVLLPMRQLPNKEMPPLEAHAFVRKQLRVGEMRKREEKKMITEKEELGAWHARFLHYDINRLAATLRERGVGVSEQTRKQVWEDCEVCEMRNAVNRSPRPVTDRREREAKSYGEVIYSDIGFLEEYLFSVIVELYTREIDVMSLNAKRDVPDHYFRFLADNRSLLPQPHRQPSIYRSNNEAVMKGKRMREVLPMTYFKKSAAYKSESQGAAENAIRMVQRLAETMLRVKGWPKAVLPEILKGLVQTYMALYTHELGTNLYNKKHSRQPDLSFICGDQVTFRPHHPKTAPKRIELQEKKGWYISKEAGATVKVMEKKEEGENEFLFYFVQKIDVLQARKGVLFEWGFKGREAASQSLLHGSLSAEQETVPEATEGVWILPQPEAGEEARKVQEGEKGHNQQKQPKTMEGRQEDRYLQVSQREIKKMNGEVVEAEREQELKEFLVESKEESEVRIEGSDIDSEHDLPAVQPESDDDSDSDTDEDETERERRTEGRKTKTDRGKQQAGYRTKKKE
uniref:Integrase catalytic domain-containing protein n=1 Tax=Chromera velia CCMP2878 TaxID=1169474 RepID=A0A0G4G8X8_9ALVE|eukprot:Cvel_20723.t1-p1 / transcript=Cvel_20723.t1 / gene=Cvel_20723 / organism=Chromera_velia_CCMP2878 / gene_product=hypothetical protein / transcript_product=hypothetical protein / location=Cvel_scaffold1886:26914-28686(-) / protein_length=591 / sequence_SO=supercontig / SO=protein_coding / is_pseudo=false